MWRRNPLDRSRDAKGSLSAPAISSVRFAPTAQYDQCGLVVRADADCWFKCSVEFEDERWSRLGSVVTNGGWSDWATQDVSSEVRAMSYEVLGRHSDLLVRWSEDGCEFRQMRVAHLATPAPWQLGVYGCSPTGSGFRFEVSEWVLDAE